MEPGPSSEVNRSASQKSLRILWNAKGSSPHSQEPSLSVPTLSQNNEIYASPGHVLIIRLNIILCLGLHLPSGFLPSCLPTKTM